MQSCFVPLLLFAIGVLVLMTLLRWFEQTAEAVDNGWWDKLLLLVFAPFVVWLFPGKVGAGRPTPGPRHEPVRGVGGARRKTPPSPAGPAAAAIPLALAAQSQE